VISHAHRCCFVHVPKTGGSSIELALTGHDWITQSPADYQVYLCEHASYTPEWGGTLCEKDPEYFARRMAVKHASQARLAADHPREWAEYLRFTFVRNPWDRVLAIHRHGRRDARERTPESLLEWLSADEPADHMGTPVFAPLIGNWDELDFIGRFELLQADFKRLCARLDAPCLALPHVTHGSSPVGYRAHYDAASRAIVAARCADEIARFGYVF